MSFDPIECERRRQDKSLRVSLPRARREHEETQAAYRFIFFENSSRQAGLRLNMYDDTHQSRESRTTDDAQKSGEFNGERKNPHVPHYAGSTCRPDGAARRVMDDLLREYLRRNR
jgi:hypothetical protein